MPSTRGLPRAFWVVLVGMFVNRAGGFVAPFMSLYLTDGRHLSIDRAGAIVSLTGFGSLAAGPIGGALADRLGRRPTMAVATGGGALCMLALGFARTDALIAGSALVLGCFGEMFRAPAMAIVVDVVAPEDRPRAFGLIYWAVNLGFAIASMTAGFVAGRSYPALFIGDAITTLAFGALVVLLVPETRPAHVAATASLRSYLVPYRHGVFVAFALVSMIVGMLFFQMGSTLPMDMRAHGIDAPTYGVLLGLNGVLIGVLQPYASTITQKLPPGRVLAAGALGAGLGLGLNEVAGGSIALRAAAVVVFTIGEVTMAGLSHAIVSELAPAHLRGSYQGAFQLAFGMAAALGPVGGSLLLAHAGPTVLWRTCVFAGIVAMAGYLVVVPRRASGNARLTIPASG